MSRIEYRAAKPNTWFGRKGRIQTIGKYIESLKDANGRVSRERVLEDARSPASPLHRYFQWDNTKAAEKYRLIQARRLIKCYVPVVIPSDNKPITVLPANVHVRTSGEPSVFISAPQAMSEEETRVQVLDDCTKLLGSIQRRLVNLKGLGRTALDLLEQLMQLLEAEREKKPSKRPKTKRT